MEYLRPLRDKIIDTMANVERVYLTGDRTARLPGHASFCVEYIEGEAMLLLLAARNNFV